MHKFWLFHAQLLPFGRNLSQGSALHLRHMSTGAGGVPVIEIVDFLTS